MLVELVVGDKGCDGHEKNVSFFVHANSKEELKDGYAAGCRILGFDFIKECCEEYEDNHIPEWALEKLQEHGLLEDIVTDDWGDFGVDWDQWVDIYLGIVKLGNPNFHIKKHTMETLGIGGYGLFF